MVICAKRGGYVQVVSEGCREAYVQRRTVRVCTGGRGRLGLDDLLLLRGLRGGLALLPLPEAVLVHEPERDDEEPGADDRADRHGDEVKPKCVAPVDARVEELAADDDAARDEELVHDEVVEARRDEELDRQPDHDELRDGLGRDHLEPDGEADHPVAARAADDGRREVRRALRARGLHELADVGLGEVLCRAEVAVVERLLERAAVREVDLLVVLEGLRGN